MIGLVKKDLYGLKRAVLNFQAIAGSLLLLISPMLLRFLNGKASYLLMNGLLCVYFATAPLGFSGRDMMYKTGRRSLTYPISSSEIVASRFISSFIVSMANFFVIFLADVVNVLLLNESFAGVFGSLFLSLGLGLFFMGAEIFCGFSGALKFQFQGFFMVLALAVGIVPMLFNKVFVQILHSFFSAVSVIRVLVLAVSFLAITAVLFFSSVKVFSWKLKKGAL